MAESIEDLFRFKVRDFKLVLDGKAKGVEFTKVNPRSGRTIKVIAYMEEDKLCIYWRDPEGAKRKTLIDLESRDSNLHKGREYFFLINSYRGRVLYSDGYYFTNRIATGLNYTQQNESRIYRRFRVIRHREDLLNAPYRKYHYRGNLTPYGKRYTKAVENYRNYVDLCNAFLIDMNRRKKNK